jgi:predicted permease
MPDEIRTSEKKPIETARMVVRIAAALLVSALSEIVLLTLLFLGHYQLGQSFESISVFLPALAALAGIPILPFAYDRKAWMSVLAYVLLTSAIMWYFQLALLVLWGQMTATGGNF